MSDKFFFYSKSSDKPPGKGTNEIIETEEEYDELGSIKHWRKMLSNFYVAPFELDGETWNSVEHFFHAVKYRDGKKPGKNYEYYKTFTIDGGMPWSLEPVNAKQAGKAGRISTTTGKVYDKKIDGVKVPKDVSMRTDFYSRQIERKLQSMAFLAKFTQHEELKRMLLATKDAELWHIVGRGAPNQLWPHLMRVRKCIRKYDKVYNLSEISKISPELVTHVLI
jgi:predicted NAD-dependent protein-ADP-ribosyltransferase YbiA (DUF1768 family)